MYRSKYRNCLLVALLTGTLLLTHVLTSARAETAALIGMVSGPQSIVRTQDQAEALEDYLAKHLSQAVKVRMFNQQATLYRWLVQHRMIDVAWLDSDFLQGVPAGAVLPVVQLKPLAGDAPSGQMVARQGGDAALAEGLRAALLKMHTNPEGRKLLAQMYGERFLPGAPWTRGGTADFLQYQDQETSLTVEGVRVEQDLPTEEVRREAKIDEFETSSTQVDAPSSLTSSTPEPVAVSQRSKPDASPQAPIALQADSLSYDQTNDLYEARGSVTLSQGEKTLAAQELIWQASTQDAMARGSVVMQEPDAEMTGQSLRYNMATGRGQLSEGRVFLREGNFHLAGAEIEKLGVATYRVADGEFTTCDGEDPDWTFSAEQVDVTLGDYAHAKHVWFHLQKVPVFYAPYLIFPVKTERSSGMLMPRYGYSSSRGTQLSLAWYQVIDRHMDATLYLDYMSELGYGKGLEYRYLLGDDNLGKAFFYHVSGISEFPDMYAYDWEHGGTLPGEAWLSADVQYVDDERFFEEFGEVAEEYNKDKTVSNVWLQRNWSKLNLVARGRYIKDLESDNDATLQRLPELNLHIPRYRIGDMPLYASLEATGTNFTRKEGEEGRRLFLKPALAASFKPGRWLEFVPEAALYERLYDADSPGDESAVPEVSATLGTRLQRTFALNLWGWDGLQHSIEPAVRYTYVPGENQEDLPFFDLNDRILESNLLEYVLVNRVTARSTSQDGLRTYREIMDLRLSQSYDIKEAREDDLNDRAPFSDLRIELDLRPTTQTFLRFDNRVKVHNDLEFSRFKAGAGWHDDQGNKLGVSYNYRDDLGPELNSEYLNLDLTTSVLAPVYLHFRERYDLESNTELEKLVDLEYRSQCWSIFFTFRDKLDEQEYFVSFALSGIGRVLGFGGGLGGDDGS